MGTEDEYLLEDAEDLTQCGKVLLTILNFCPAKVTRIHKISLFINAVINNSCVKPDSHGAYHFGGFSEEIDSAMTQLLEDGIVTKIGEEYYITDYGKKLNKLLNQNPKDEYIQEINEKGLPLLQNLSSLSDKQLLKLTYILFPETTKNSVIKDQVEKDHRTIKVKDLYITTGSKQDLKDIIEKISRDH